MARIILALAAFRGEISPQSFDRIELGMSRSQVEFILGQPSLGHIEADYDDFFETMLAHDLKREGELWRSGFLRIWIRFDEHDRVNGKLLQRANRFRALHVARDLNAPPQPLEQVCVGAGLLLPCGCCSGAVASEPVGRGSGLENGMVSSVQSGDPPLTLRGNY